MDHPRRGDGRSEHSAAHHASHSKYPPQIPAAQEGSIAGSTTQRYRPAPLDLSTSTPRSMGVSGNYSNYYQDSSSGFSAPTMSTTLLAYGTDYGSDTRNPAPTMGSYSTSMMMYNVPHTAAQQSVYDTQQFTPRQHAAMQMMPADVSPTYFTSEAAGNTATPLQASDHGSSSSPNVYQNHQQNLGMPYSRTMSGVNELHHQQQPSSSHPGAPETRDFTSNEDAALEKWENFRRQLGMVFQDISVGQLERASGTLLGISTWMLSQVVELGKNTEGIRFLCDPPKGNMVITEREREREYVGTNQTVNSGLHQDNSALHEDRLRLWNDFNHAWLALAFQQKELMTCREQASRSPRLMTEETVQRMGDELVRLCDGVERHGLVDYQYGVWEEQIEAGA